MYLIYQNNYEYPMVEEQYYGCYTDTSQISDDGTTLVAKLDSYEEAKRTALEMIDSILTGKIDKAKDPYNYDSEEIVIAAIQNEKKYNPQEIHILNEQGEEVGEEMGELYDCPKGGIYYGIYLSSYYDGTYTLQDSYIGLDRDHHVYGVKGPENWAPLLRIVKAHVEYKPHYVLD